MRREEGKKNSAYDLSSLLEPENLTPNEGSSKSLGMREGEGN